MNKDRLLKYVQIAYADIEQTVSTLNDIQMTQLGVEGEWSMKDLIGHLTYWQQREANFLKQARGLTVDRHYPNVDVDSQNSIAYAENRNRPLDEILEDYRRSYRDIVEEVKALSEADLMETKRFAWTEGEELWGSIAGETYLHAGEHMPAVRKWLDQVQGQAWPQA
jgi:hypothetical protein